ncbi:signal peptidase I [Intrasporangium sp.]|uniref:signal peptidase I n=1 Tax=Intrasporangium sp. TaxID=1925024 RepID=UPI00322221D8
MSTQHPERSPDAGSPGRPGVDAEDPDAGRDPAPSPRGFGASLLAGLREIVIVVVLAMALSFVVKTWLFQAFYIPSGSMEDTLVPDDRVIVSKLTPGPFELRRGDVVVFEDPGKPRPWLQGAQYSQPSTLGGPFHELLVFVGLLPEDSENHLIKRVIGLPGDHVQADGKGKIRVNGVEITEPYIKPGDHPSDQPFDIVVPPDSIWVMGDHRSDSSDSRFHDDDSGGKDGSVPMSKIVGRALFIVWPIDHVTWLGVPSRTFEKVPAPSAVRPTDLPKAPAKSTAAKPAPAT